MKRKRRDAAGGIGVGRDDVKWAYRLFLDREPDNDEIVRMVAAAASIVDLRRVLLTSDEFRQKNPLDLAFTVESTIVVKEIGPGLRLFLDLSDVEIGLNVARGRYETDEIAFMRDTIRPGDFVVDVGANIGFHTMWMASFVGPLGHVYAYEPLESNAALLKKSLRENGLEGRVTLRPDAVGIARDNAEMVFLPLQDGSQNSGGAYLMPPSGRLPTKHKVVRTRVVSLDSEEFLHPVRFMKVDVEGSEPLVFRGARRLLSEDRPVVLSEVNPGQIRNVSGSTPAQLIADMGDIGYECALVESGDSNRVIEDVPDERVRSVVFRPRRGSST
jgi:FkbM family methyltransferase